MTKHDTPALRITAKRAGFRRAGMAHPATATAHPAGTFTADQVEALRADPMLVVEDLPPEDAKTTAQGGKTPPKGGGK